jgi:hypothetical protein
MPCSNSCYCSFNRVLFNSDEMRLGQPDTTKTHLCFESRFESGNLRKALQVRQSTSCVLRAGTTCWETGKGLVDQLNVAGFLRLVILHRVNLLLKFWPMKLFEFCSIQRISSQDKFICNRTFQSRPQHHIKLAQAKYSYLLFALSSGEAGQWAEGITFSVSCVFVHVRTCWTP